MKRSTSRCSVTGRSITMAGARYVRTRGRRLRKRPWSSARPSRKTSCENWMPSTGNCTTLRRIRRKPKTWQRNERARMIEMIAMWYVEAGKYKVLPIDSR